MKGLQQMKDKRGREMNSETCKNFAGCEISQPAKFYRLRKFRNLENF